MFLVKALGALSFAAAILATGEEIPMEELVPTEQGCTFRRSARSRPFEPGFTGMLYF
jgi:hypothetical protein